MTGKKSSDDISFNSSTAEPTYRLIPLYGDLIKVKQTFLLLFSGIFSWLISIWPALDLLSFAWITMSLLFSVAGATLLNMYIDRDIDAIMERTRHRALPSGRLSPGTVVTAGAACSCTGIVIAGICINLVTMAVIFLGVFFDVIVYSLWLKRRTRFSILFGGISGGLPVMAGRTAVTGSVDALAVLMSLFILCWIPMHILSLALIPENLENYRKAGVPMWSVVRSKNETAGVISLSALVSVGIIVAIGMVLDIPPFHMVPVYCISAYMIFLAFMNMKYPSIRGIFRLFKVASLFVAVSFLWLFMVRVM